MPEAGSAASPATLSWKRATALGNTSSTLLLMPVRPPSMAVKTVWSWLFTRLVSMRVTMDMVQELRVIGMASLSRWERMSPLLSGTSWAGRAWRRLVRAWLKNRKTTDRMLPTDTPSRAPAADRRSRRSSGWMAMRMMMMASVRPRKSLHSASIIWEMAVGTMFKCPWA